MKNLLATLVIVLLALSAFSLISAYTTPAVKVGYISNAEVYDSFILKKELESKISNTKSTRKVLLDSMLLSLELRAKEIERSKPEKDDQVMKDFEMLRQQYLIKEEQLNSDNERMVQQYTDQVWTQLNQFIQEYGKENGYAFIHGAVGNGSLMYGEEKYNITKEVIEYVNKRYNGKK